MKEYQKILDWYMEKLDSWVDESKYNSRKGVFSGLSEALLVRKLAASPNGKKPLEGLQSFLATEILGIHRNKASKNSYSIIQRYLAGEDLKKSYRFMFDILPETLDKEANKAAFLAQSKVLKAACEKRGDDYLQKEIEQCEEWLPFILLDEARHVLWTKMDNFYFVCNANICDKCPKKPHKYYQFVQAAVLFEILYLEFIQGPLHEHVKKGNDLVKSMQGETADIDFDMKQFCNAKGDVAGAEALNQCISEFGEKISELTEEVSLVNLFSLLEAEFAGDICAMYHLLMVIENMNVYEENIYDPPLASKLDSDFKKNYGKIFESFGYTNADKAATYRRVNEYMEMVLSKYADEKYDVAKNIVGFLEELKKKREEEDAPDYEHYLYTLAMPIYRSLGGTKEQINS